jgi:hypothetical protein
MYHTKRLEIQRLLVVLVMGFGFECIIAELCQDAVSIQTASESESNQIDLLSDYIGYIIDDHFQISDNFHDPHDWSGNEPYYMGSNRRKADWDRLIFMRQVVECKYPLAWNMVDPRCDDSDPATIDYELFGRCYRAFKTSESRLDALTMFDFMELCLIFPERFWLKPICGNDKACIDYASEGKQFLNQVIENDERLSNDMKFGYESERETRRRTAYSKNGEKCISWIRGFEYTFLYRL